MNDELFEELVVRIYRYGWGNPNVTAQFVYDELEAWMEEEELTVKDYYKALDELVHRGWIIVYPYSATNIQYRKPNGF